VILRWLAILKLILDAILSNEILSDCSPYLNMDSAKLSKSVIELALFLLSATSDDDEEKLPVLKFSDTDVGKDDKASKISSPPVYKWSQDSEGVTISFKVPENIKKDEITCNIRADSLELQVGKEAMLSGPLFAKVNSEESTWTLDKNR